MISPENRIPRKVKTATIIQKHENLVKKYLYQLVVLGVNRRGESCIRPFYFRHQSTLLKSIIEIAKIRTLSLPKGLFLDLFFALASFRQTKRK
jgi:hypothetical protein